MRRIGDLSCLWLSDAEPNPVAAQRLYAHFPNALKFSASDRDAIRTVVEQTEGGWLLVLGPDCLTYSTLALMEPESAIISAGVACSYLSRNTVTNEIVIGHGPALWPTTGFLDELESGAPDLSPQPHLPSVQAHWFVNPDPATALINGYESTLGKIETEEAEAVARSASLGADVRFGAFWQIGCCHAILGSASAAEALDDVSDLLDDENGAARAALALSRSVRLGGQYEVRCLSDAESRLMKMLRPEAVTADYYQRFANFCETLGPAAAARAKQYREAAYWLGDGSDMSGCARF